MPPSITRQFLGFAFAACSLVGACSDTIRLGQNLPGLPAGAGGISAGFGGTLSFTGGAGIATGGATAGTTASAVCQVTSCLGKIYQCGDCLDNDGDGLVDSLDPECTGACDNTEDSFYSGIPGQNNAACRQDCYFTIPGNNDCFWNQKCDSLSLAPDYPPSGDAQCAYDLAAKTPGTMASCAELATTQSAACLDYCTPLTPNGCDCFGCCELPADSGKFVWIGSTNRNVGSCNLGSLADPSACHPCTPVKSCFNSCDACEVCVGRTSQSSDCAGSGTQRCSAGVTACGQPGEAPCGSDQYCVTGCCSGAPK